MYKKIAATFALALAAAVSAHAAPLGLNSTIPASAGTFGTFNFVANTGIRNLSSPTFNVNYGEAVAYDTANPLGGLEFIYSFDNVGATGVVESVSMYNYDGFTTDAIFVSKGLGNEVAPGSVSRATTGAGSVVRFNFNVPGVSTGQTTDYLVIRTDATNYTTGNYTFQDGTTASDLNVFAPAASTVTPEPSSLVLLGTGLLGAAGIARRKFASKFGV